MRRVVYTLLLASTLLIASPAFAQGGDMRAQGGDMKAQGIYIGGSIGAGVFRAESDSGIPLIDDSAVGFKLIGGYRTKFFALESDWRSLGTVKGIIENTNTKTTGFAVSGLLMLPVGPVDIFGRGGAFFWNNKIQLDPNFAAVTETGTSFIYGAGLAFRLGSLSLRLEGERLKLSEQHDQVWFFSGGVTVAF